jgi:CHAT domain-containing protein
MKLKTLFIWIIGLGLITSCARVPEHPNEAVTSSTTQAKMDNDSLVRPSFPQQPSQQPVLPRANQQNPPVTAYSQPIQPTSLAPAQQLELAKAETYLNQADQYYQQGQFQQALPWLKKAFQIRTTILGEKHPRTLGTLNNLAEIYRQLGRFSEALPLLEKSYRFHKAVLGEKHPHTFRSGNNLAMIYQDLGRLDEALPLYNKSYRLSKAVLGDKHAFTLLSMNNLASLYKDLGRLSEALPLYQNGYRLSKETLGEQHPDTLTSLNNLAGIYEGLGRLSEALPLRQKVYRLSKDVLGKKHPNSIISLNNLAMSYNRSGKLSEALPLFEKSYRLHDEVFGEQHPNTFISLINLTDIYQDLGRLSEALPLSEKAYHLIKPVLGEKHPLTLTTLNNLASLYQDLGRLSAALPLFEKSYLLRLEVLGEQHPYTLTGLNNLAEIYGELGRFSEALPLVEKGYRLKKAVFGEKHPETLISMNNLAMNYQNLGRLSEALPLHKKVYRLSKEVLGDQHQLTMTNRNNLALIYNKLGQLPKALPLYEKNYRLSKEVLGEKHPDTLSSLSNLAIFYQNLGRLSEALPLSEKSYRLRKELLGEKHPDTLASLNNLAHIYTEQGHVKKAIQHLEQFVAGVEHLRSGNLSAENRQGLFKQWVHGYFGLSLLYTVKSRSVDAFRLAEMSKARTLLESLAAKLAAQQTGLSSAEQQKRQDNDARLAILNNRIAKALEDNRLEDRIRLEAEKNQLLKKHQQFHQQLLAKYPKYAQLSKVQIIEAQTGAKYLPTDAVLISYLVNKNQVLAFTLQPNGQLTAHDLDLGEIPNLETDIKDYHQRLLKGSRGQPLRPLRRNKTAKLSRQLGKRLLEPLLSIIKDKPHWIISPSGPLALIPFETLRLERQQQPVITQHQISYVQSLSVLALLRQRDRVYQRLQNRGSLLAMGAPIYQPTISANPALLNEETPNTADINIARGLVQSSDEPNRYARAFRQLNLNWENLPGTLAELEQLEKLFQGQKPLIYKQADATETKLQHLNQQGLLAKYRYLVFSAHGYLSPQVPALSAIVLGQLNNPPGIDGYITAGEWPGYDLKSDLMVLSACETGRGELINGEGIMGLPYAFYVAGNKNTLLTLWKIADNLTVEFITSFFAKLNAGQKQIEALTATKREFINKGLPYSKPAYWAAFVLYGV